ncbi:MAG: geranylgeranylglycerol-phosphate geranylgeranyltransferase [Paludibacteraceae bacterium]|nr:geranylgeranylglycerol-phosphate geranylgeranyltransferase [Paludibacteraceae bacterium]
MNFLNLIRYKNLIFIAGLQWLMYYSIILPVLRVYQIDLQYAMSGLQFALLVGASVFIAAGGYVINDYFDTRIDEINRPEKVIIGKSISKKQASLIHQVFTGIGVVLGLTVAYFSKSLTVGLIVAIVPGLLWFYSASYKRQFLLGNVVVALNAAFVPLIIVTAETAFLSRPENYGDLITQTPIIPTLYVWICGFAAFAFLTTLIREIIKDIEDEHGDREMESRTIPIVWGAAKTKILLYGLIAITLGLVAFAYTKFISGFGLFGIEKSSLAIRYIIFGLFIPFAYLVFLLIKAKTPANYHQAATFCKFIMVIGALFSLIFYFLLAKGQGIPMFDLFIVK